MMKKFTQSITSWMSVMINPSYTPVFTKHSKGTIRLLCPHACGKCNCPMGSAWCSSSNTGYVGKVKIEDNPRLITAPFRAAAAFVKLYNQRTSVLTCSFLNQLRFLKIMIKYIFGSCIKKRKLV